MSAIAIGLVSLLVTILIVVIIVLVLYYTGHLGSCASKGSPPAAPTNLKVILAGCTSTTVELSWLSSSTSSKDNYTVTYKDPSSGVWSTAVSNNPGTTYTVSGLNPSTMYQFQVVANNSAGTSSPITIYGQTYGNITNFRNVATSSQFLAVDWNPYPNVNYYMIYAYTPGKSLLNPDAMQRIESDQSSGSISGLSPNTSYTIVILAAGTDVNQTPIGWATLNATTTATSGPVLVLPPFTQFTVTSSTATTVNLSWSPVAGAVSYRYGDVNAGDNGFSTVTTSGTVTGLVAGTSYTVGVVAVDGYGNPLAESTATAATANA